MRPLLILSCLITSTAFAADLPLLPAEPIAKKKELLFSDDFQGAVPSPLWHKVVPTFALENGTLKGTQTRDQNIPAADGKPAVMPHAAVYGLEIPTKDSVIEVKIRFEGASLIDVEFDDRKFTGSHYGHLCRAQVRLDKVTIVDERDGNQSNALIELRKDAVKNKEEIGKLLASHSVSYPVKLETGKWYTMGVETAGDTMRVTLDGKAAAFFQSPGIGHATKSKIELGVAGKDGFFDEIKVWNAEPAK
ncbi:MAG: hypothetical protein JWL59_4651 [Chthoniobacteraceae bacterium]|nr:hypothetical protein [Chthoniobacteraceae bacterium]